MPPDERPRAAIPEAHVETFISLQNGGKVHVSCFCALAQNHLSQVRPLPDTRAIPPKQHFSITERNDSP